MNADNLDRKIDKLVIAELGDQIEKDEAINKGDCRSAVTDIDNLDLKIDELTAGMNAAFKRSDYLEAANIREQIDHVKLKKRRFQGNSPVPDRNDLLMQLHDKQVISSQTLLDEMEGTGEGYVRPEANCRRNKMSDTEIMDCKINELSNMKDEAVKSGDYVRAAKIRDQIDEVKLKERRFQGDPPLDMNALSTHVDGLFAKQAERKAEKQNHEVLQKRWYAGFAADWDKAAVRSDKPKLEPQLKRSDGFLKAIVLCDDKVARPADLHSLEEADVIVTTSGKVLKNRYGKTTPPSAPSLPSADSRNRSDKPHIVDWGMSPEAVYALLAMTEDRTRLRAELHGLQASHDRLLAACRRFTGSHAAALGASIHGDGTDQPPATPTCECAECKFTRDAISQGLKPGAEDVRPPREDAPREDRNHLNRKALAREALETLSGDLSYDNVAAAKQILKQITGETK